MTAVQKKNMPSHKLLVVEKYEKDGEEKSRWTDVGVAFPNSKKGFNCRLRALPPDGQFVMLPWEDEAQS